MKQPTLYLCYSINDLFAMEAGISLTGFLENNPDYEPDEIFVLDYGIHTANKQRLDEVAGRYGRRITYIDSRPVTSAVKKEFPHLTGWRGSMAPNAKCFADEIMPDYVERLLFLDADTLVAGSIDELQQMDMDGTALGVVPGNTYVKKILFNSGVLLFNLPVWRSENCHQMILDTLRSTKHLAMPDQDLLNNAIPQKLLKPLPLKFNYLSHFFHPKQVRDRLRLGDVYTEEEIEEAINHPVILHYLGGWIMARPWHEGCRSYRKEEYLHYKSLSPWKDIPLIGKYGGVLAPKGVRQHINYWRLKTYSAWPSYRLTNMLDTSCKAVISVIDKIKGKK